MNAVRTLTWLDLGICASFAVPGVAALTFGVLDVASRALGFADVVYPTGAAAFFVNLAGLFGVLWNVAMLSVRTPSLHQVDLVARLGVIGLIVYHIAVSGLSPVFLAFVATEVVGAGFKLRWLPTLEPADAPSASAVDDAGR